MDTIIFDITRTIMRSAHAAPTGIDRVERAYFEWVLTQKQRKMIFLCRIKGAQVVISRATAQEIYDETAFRPQPDASDFSESRRQRILRGYRNQFSVFMRGESWFRTPEAGARAFAKAGVTPGSSIYMNVSHNNIDPFALNLLRKIGVGRIAAFVHDVIPVDYPEYVVRDAARKFQLKLNALAEHADGLIFNSNFTQESTLAQLAKLTDRRFETMVGYLGLNDVWHQQDPQPAIGDTPYFVTLGTIEPRKNHLLLLNVWRRLSDEMENPPHLRIIGWRGWENENILDMLDRAPFMKKTVFEHAGLPDSTVRSWIAGSRALLYPTFVEGFGIPVAEALIVGAPVICSDLPVLREVGGDAPDYIDPLDGVGWMRAIKEYAQPEHQRRNAQLQRMQGYQPPSWPEHLQNVGAFLDRLN